MSHQHRQRARPHVRGVRCTSQHCLGGRELWRSKTRQNKQNQQNIEAASPTSTASMCAHTYGACAARPSTAWARASFAEARKDKTNKTNKTLQLQVPPAQPACAPAHTGRALHVPALPGRARALEKQDKTKQTKPTKHSTFAARRGRLEPIKHVCDGFVHLCSWLTKVVSKQVPQLSNEHSRWCWCWFGGSLGAFHGRDP